MYQLRDLVVPSISIVSATLVIFLLVLRYLKPSNGLPPGPRGLPFIGSLFSLDAESYWTFDKWGKIYGDILTVQLGWDNVVVLNSLDTLNVLKDQAEKFAFRPILPIIKLGFTIPGSLVFENGHTGNERRRWTVSFIRDFCLGTKEFGKRRNLENLLDIETDYLCKEFANQEGQSFNPFHCLHNAVANIICSVGFGDRFEYNDPKFQGMMNGMRYLFKMSSMTSPVNAIPMLFHTPIYNKFRQVTSNIIAFIDEIIDQHEKTFDCRDIRDLIDAYIVETQKKDVDPTVFSKDKLWRTILDLFGGGTDTTSCTVQFVILYLVHYPEIQKKVKEEIDEVIGHSRKPKWGDRHSLPYLVATIMEVQRLSNVAPQTGRLTTQEVKINGYRIPANTTVLGNMFSVHRHPDYWERPLFFEPERFLMDDLKTLKNQPAFMPFGLGRRMCLADFMARIEVFVFTANLLQRFTFKVPEGKPIPSVDDCVPGLSRSPKPFEICAFKR